MIIFNVHLTLTSVVFEFYKFLRFISGGPI
nr:MAG TPA: hypothetical protein [Caudoviricetes sp.]